MDSSHLHGWRDHWGRALDETIRHALDSSVLDGRLAGMLAYQMGYVGAALEPMDAPTGKRFRPAICALACRGVGGQADDALPLAAAIELLHNFSLVHDDIEDRDPVRRHRPTLWKVWGEAHAINAGDAMFALAGRLVLDASDDPAVSLALAARFQETTLELTDGQYRDMSFETRSAVSPEEYLRMIELKSAALIAFSAWSGGYLGGLHGDRAVALSEFGRHLGLAFQIRDDIMGIWGSARATGKQEAKDLENRKKTLPLLVALARAEGETRAHLQAFLAHDNGDVARARDILTGCGAQEACMAQARHHLAAAEASLTGARLRDEEHADLRSLAREVVG